MSFSVEGDYFEVCNCDVSCNCVWLGAATNDHCDVLLAWHVARGSKDGVDLSGLNAVGMDGQEPAVITNAPFGAVPQPVRQARAKDVSYHGHWSADFSGTNSFVTDFRYEG